MLSCAHKARAVSLCNSDSKRNRSSSLLICLLYLLLPNLLFLIGWIRSWLALPLATVLLISVIYAWLRSNCNSSHTSAYTAKDYAALALTLMLGLLLVESLGLNGHMAQMGDFNVRTPIYYTLINQPWPIFSESGDYFIYYHIFWLPPALIAKYTSSWISADTILFAWIYFGIVLFILLLFRRHRSKILVLFILICLLGSIVDLLYAPCSYAETSGLQSDWVDFLKGISVGRKNYRFVTFYGNIFTFNAWVPSILALGIFWERSLRLSDFAYVITLILGSAFFQCFPLGVLFLAFLLHRKSFISKTLKNPLSWIGVILCFLYVIYFAGQMGKGSASAIHFIASEAFPLPLKTKIYRYIIILITALLPAFLILPKSYQRNAYFSSMLFIGVFTPLFWIGRANNEFCFKSGQIFYMIFSYLLFLHWNRAKRKRKVLITIFVLLSSIHFFGDLYRRDICHYGWNDATRQKHIIPCNMEHINKPEGYYYYNFYGVVKFPLIQYNHPGESYIK